MGKQTHILRLSPVFQAVMGYGLKPGGLLPDLYAVFKQVSLLQVCSGTRSNRICVRGIRSLEHTTVCHSSLGATGWTAAGVGVLEHLGMALLTGSLLWFIDKNFHFHHGKQCCSQHISLVWSIIRLAFFSCFFFVLFCFNGRKYISAEPATLASEATYNAVHIASACRPRLCSSWGVSL